MTFNKSHLSDTPGTAGDYARTYTYTVKEVAPTTGAIDKLRYSKAEYQVAVTVEAELNKAGKYSGLTTSTTVTQMKDDMGNAWVRTGRASCSTLRRRARRHSRLHLHQHLLHHSAPFWYVGRHSDVPCRRGGALRCCGLDAHSSQGECEGR